MTALGDGVFFLSLKLMLDTSRAEPSDPPWISDRGHAIAIGVLANTLLKLVIGVVLGLRRFRRIVSVSLFTVALACAISLAWQR